MCTLFHSYIHTKHLTCCRISIKFWAFIRVFGEIKPTQWESIAVVPCFFSFSDTASLSYNLTQYAKTEI
jgi:hypothetical protein